jgi:hypothetical protein
VGTLGMHLIYNSWLYSILSKCTSSAVGMAQMIECLPSTHKTPRKQYGGFCHMILGIYPKKCDSDHSRSTCTPMFIVTLFTIAKLWKQLRCPTSDEWIKKMWYLYTTEFYSAMKNEILSFTSKWMELENIILSEVSQAQKTKNHMLSLICRLQM